MRSGRRYDELTYNHPAQRDDVTPGLALGFLER